MTVSATEAKGPSLGRGAFSFPLRRGETAPLTPDEGTLHLIIVLKIIAKRRRFGGEKLGERGQGQGIGVDRYRLISIGIDCRYRYQSIPIDTYRHLPQPTVAINSFAYPDSQGTRSSSKTVCRRFDPSWRYACASPCRKADNSARPPLRPSRRVLQGESSLGSL